MGSSRRVNWGNFSADRGELAGTKFVGLDWGCRAVGLNPGDRCICGYTAFYCCGKMLGFIYSFSGTLFKFACISTVWLLDFGLDNLDFLICRR